MGYATATCFRLVLLGAAIGVLLLQPATASAAPPPNDDFGNATIISSLPFSHTVENSEATIEADEPGNCANATQTVWYSFTPSSDIAVRADMAGSSNTGATNLNVYEQTSSGVAGLNFLGCATFGDPIQFTATAGKTYYLQAETFLGNVATLQVNLFVPPPPPFDDIANAKTIPDPSSWFGGGRVDRDDTTFTTTAPGDPTCFGNGHTVWYVFVPPEDMKLEAAIHHTPAGGPPHFTLSAYVGSPGSLSQLDCSDDSFVLSGNQVPHVEFSAKAGVPVYLMIGTSGDSGGGPFFLSIQRPLVITTTLNRLGKVSRTGTATVAGKVTCSRPVAQNGIIGLSQIRGGLVATGVLNTAFFECGPSRTLWSAEISSWTGVPFGQGKAIMSTQWTSQCDNQGCQPGALFGEGYGRVHTATTLLRRIN